MLPFRLYYYNIQVYRYRFYNISTCSIYQYAVQHAYLYLYVQTKCTHRRRGVYARLLDRHTRANRTKPPMLKMAFRVFFVSFVSLRLPIFSAPTRRAFKRKIYNSLQLIFSACFISYNTYTPHTLRTRCLYDAIKTQFFISLSTQRTLKSE